MEREAARPKGRSSVFDDDAPNTQPMRPGRGDIARNPSTDQKRVRREMRRKVAVVDDEVLNHIMRRDPSGFSHEPTEEDYRNHEQWAKDVYGQDAWDRYNSGAWGHQPGDEPRHIESAKTATVLDTQAWKLNPGDSIRLPNGKTQRVTRVRPHETSMDHVYVDTDGGTALARRMDAFQVVPHNSLQQEIPGYGVPGGNTNITPETHQHGDNTAPSNVCPVCGGKGTLRRHGDHYVCSRCGYQEQFGGASNHSFSDSAQRLRTSSYTTINGPIQSAVARRASQMLNQKESL